MRNPTWKMLADRINFCMLLSCAECRSLLLANTCRHLRYHLGHRDELRLCMDILTEILSFLYHKSRLQQDPQGKVNTFCEIVANCNLNIFEKKRKKKCFFLFR